MKYLHILSLGLFFLIGHSCSEKLEKEVMSVYPNGTPMLVNYYKDEGGKRYVAKEIRFYPNAEKSSEGGWTADNKKDGTWTQWFVNGEMWVEENYKRGSRHGAVSVWQENGEKEFEGEYTNDLPSGTWKFYDKKGNKIKEQKY